MLHLSPAIDIYIGTISFVLGACMGSFLNCMSWRVVHGESVIKGRSHCDYCGAALSARDLVPVLSYLMSRGKCRRCGAKLSVRHLWAELLTGVVYLLLVFRFDISLQALEMLLFASLLMASAFADLEGYIIPDRYIIAGTIIRVPFFFSPTEGVSVLIDSLIGGFAVGGVLLGVVLLYERLRQKEAMGGGDLKLLFMTGLYLGWMKNILCLLLACLIGIVFGLISQKKHEGGEEARLIPWGPSIAAAAIITLLVGDTAISAYLSMF